MSRFEGGTPHTMHDLVRHTYVYDIWRAEERWHGFFGPRQEIGLPLWHSTNRSMDGILAPYWRRRWWKQP